jgi:uncharacterized protein (TIGR04255 family)
MASPRQLRSPPITEALVDFRILAKSPVDPGRLRQLAEELKPDFPTSEEKQQFRAEFRVEHGKLAPPIQEDLGFQGVWVKNESGTLVAQLRTDGFTLNNIGLGAYVGGERLINDSLALWSRYADAVQPAAVVRLALRYLNRLDLPLAEGEEFSRFLTTRVELPLGAPQLVSSFVNRVVSHDETTGATAIVTQKLDAPGTPARPVPIIVDVDVVFEQELSVEPGALREMLLVLRDLKNRCFFALLTDEAVKIYA